MLRPLQKKNKDGQLYVRPDVIETMIEGAVGQTVETLVRRAWIPDQASSDFLASECLVYLIRDAWLRHDEQTMSALLPLLLARCDKVLKANLSDRDLPNVNEMCDDILGKFSSLFIEDGTGDKPNLLDYFECRFNLAFRALRINHIRQELKIFNRTVPLPIGDDENDGSASDEILFRLSGTINIPVSKQQDAFLADSFLQDLLTAIDALPPDERDAVVLCHIMKYKEEAEDPSEQTAATLCGVSGRTIRNRLTRAAKKLSRFDKET